MAAKPSSIIIILFFLVVASSEARVLKLSDGGAATAPPLNPISLPGDTNYYAGPCEHMVRAMGSDNYFTKAPRLGGKYGPMVLNALPKGMVPPSAPSKRTNNFNN